MAKQSSQTDNTIMALLKIERFRSIVYWLCEHWEELGSLEKVQIVFDCAGKTVNAKRTDSYHNI